MNQTLDSNLFEVIIIDDGSNDDSSTIIKEFIDNHLTETSPNFIYHRKLNEGLSVARNSGLKKSNAQYVVYVDEDAIALPDYLSVILEYFDTHPNVNCLGGEVELYNTDNKFARLLQDSIFSLYMKNEGAIIGTNMAYRKDFLIDINGFQPEFTYRGDETALFEKAKGRLVKGRCKKMRVKHFQPANLKLWLKTRSENGYFKAAIDLFAKKSIVQLCFNLLKSCLIISLPIQIFLILLLIPSHTIYAFIMSVFTISLILQKFILNNVVRDTLIEFKINRNTKTNLKDAATISFMIVIGEYLANIGYVRGLRKYRNTKWVV